MTPRNKITIRTFTANDGYLTWAPDDFLMKIAAAIALIPEAERGPHGSGIVELEGYGESSSAELTIKYVREENDEEYGERMAREKLLQEQRDKAALEQYRALKARFGHLPEG